MATLYFNTLNYAAGRGSNAPTVNSSDVKQSGTFVTSATAAQVTGLTPSSGDHVRVFSTGNIWLRFGGLTAALGTGFFVPANQSVDIEVHQSGNVSVIDA